MITPSRNTYSSHGSNSLDQVLIEPLFSFKLAKLGSLLVQTWSTWNLMSWNELTIYRASSLPCLRQAFCHKNKQNDYRKYLIEWFLEAETHIAPTVVTLWARFPLLEPPFVCYIGKSRPSKGQNMFHLKSDVMKTTSYIWKQHLDMFKASILPQEQTKWLQWRFI